MFKKKKEILVLTVVIYLGHFLMFVLNVMDDSAGLVRGSCRELLTVV